MDFLQMMGGALVIAAVTLIQFHREQDEKAPAIMRTRRKQRKIQRQTGSILSSSFSSCLSRRMGGAIQFLLNNTDLE
jgi:hypothetical protein